MAERTHADGPLACPYCGHDIDSTFEDEGPHICGRCGRSFLVDEVADESSVRITAIPIEDVPC